MLPFEEEMLDKTVLLDCGAEVVEWRSESSMNVDRLNELCNFVDDRFFQFAKEQGYELINTKKFYFPVSFIPWDNGYRNLNDIAYRFIKRPQKHKLDGYTSYVKHHLFARSDINYKEFEVTFIHELVHAYSDFYGIELIQYKNGESNEDFVEEFLDQYYY